MFGFKTEFAVMNALENSYILIFVFSVVIIMVETFRFSWWWYNGKCFGEFFSIPPTKKNKRTPGEQEIINQKLTSLSESFFIAAEEEVRLYNFIKESREKSFTNEVILIEIREKQITINTRVIVEKNSTLAEIVGAVKDEVSKRKKKFWEAHRLAKKFEYKWKEKIESYKPAELRSL